MKIALFLLTIFITNVIQAITGFAGSILAMPPSAYLLGLNDARVSLNILTFFSALFIAFSSWRNIQWKKMFYMLSVMGVGILIGVAVCIYVTSDRILLFIYGIVMIVIALKNLFLKKVVIYPKWALAIVLILSGIMQQIKWW